MLAPSRTQENPLTGFSIGDLITLYDAKKYAADAYLAFLNQPRVQGELEKHIEAEWDACLTVCDTIEDEIEARTPTGEDRLARLVFLAKVQLKHENFENVVRLVTQAAIQNAADWEAFKAKHLLVTA